MRELEPGLHVFWKVNRGINVNIFDKRVQTLEVGGQWMERSFLDAGELGWAAPQLRIRARSATGQVAGAARN